MSIISEARDHYNKTIKHPDYAKSHIWQDESENHKDLMRIINTCETPESVSEELRKTDMYAIRIHDQETFDLMLQWHTDAFFREETVVPSWQLSLANTPNLMKMLFYCQHIKNHCKEYNTIVELGGGNGQLSYIAKKILKNAIHIDIDIPESLYMAYVGTRQRFPDSKCQWINQGDQINDDTEFVFIPVGNESVILNKDIDLFINTASMGELPNEKIRYWMDFVQNKINVKYFYGFNRFLNTIDHKDEGFSKARHNENEASVLFDHHWKVLKWEVEPLMARCPYEDPKIARYLEIILKREPNAHFLTNCDTGDIKMEDWFRYRDIGCVGTHRSNQLVNDFTQAGTLFKLWDAFRIEPKKDTAQLILQYLKHIGRLGLIFEEELYYQKFIDKAEDNE